MSKHYKTVLLVRFSGYLIFFTGLIGFIFILGPLAQAETKYRIDKILGVKRVLSSKVVTSDIATASASLQGPASFGSVAISENVIVPVSTKYGIVIEKINANAKIVPDVDPSDEKIYVRALQEGVAAAAGSTLPGKPGNMYLFSHSTDAPWNIIRYNAVFYLLSKLEVGDRIVIFWDNIRYDYIVFDKNTVSPSDISYITNTYDTPVLTLQTCDPPGTLLRRLVVRAKLVSS